MNSPLIVVAGIDRRLQRIRRTARLAADQVARLVGGDGEEPGSKASLRVELVGGLVNLEERFLKDVLGRGAVTEEAHEKMKQLALIAGDERRKALAIALTIVSQKLFVGALLACHRSGLGKPRDDGTAADRSGWRRNGRTRAIGVAVVWRRGPATSVPIVRYAVHCTSPTKQLWCESSTSKGRASAPLRRA